MTSEWTVIALVLAGVSTACAGACGAMLLRFRRSAAARQHDLERQVEALRDMVQILEARIPEDYAALETPDVTPQIDRVSADRDDVPSLEEDPLSPEMQAVIAAVAVACVGRHARVRSARLVSSPHASPWSQQGRMLVQTSHNVRAKV